MKLSHELETALHAAKEAGKIHMKYFGKPLQKQFKAPQDMVTQVDFECEKKIKSILQKEFPDYGIIAEESGTTQTTSDYQWIIDPLDGTFYYSRGIPSFAVLIALKKKETIELGILGQSAQHQMLCAQKNKGTFLNGQRIFVSKQKQWNGALLGYNEVRFQLEYHPKPFQQLLNSVVWRTGTTPLNGFKYLCQGTLDVFLYSYVRYQPNKPMQIWDIAAPKILVEEAGGIFSNYQGETSLNKIDAVIAGNPALHKKTLQFFRGKTQ